MTTTKNNETPGSGDGTGLAEALLGLDGFRVLAVDETPAEVVIEVETTADRVGCADCGVRAEAQDRMIVEIRDLPCFGRPARLVWRKRRWRCREPLCEALLIVVLADEVARRERRSATTRARAAGLDATMTLEGWDNSTDAVYDRDLWAELCTLRLVDERRDLVIMGPVGVGKTFMASAVGHIACRRRRTTHMARADQLAKRLPASRLDDTHDTELRRLIPLELLILDDFCLHTLDETDAADIYELRAEPISSCAGVAGRCRRR